MNNSYFSNHQSKSSIPSNLCQVAKFVFQITHPDKSQDIQLQYFLEIYQRHLALGMQVIILQIRHA